MLLALSLQLSHHPAQLISDGLSEETPMGPLTNDRGKYGQIFRCFFHDRSLISSSRRRRSLIFASSILKTQLYHLENRWLAIPMYRFITSPFTKGVTFWEWLQVAIYFPHQRWTQHLFLCEMFFASDALRGSTLDSKGLGGLVCGGNNQLADEEFECLKSLWMKVDQIPTFLKRFLYPMIFFWG